MVFFGRKGLVDCSNDVWKLSLTDLSWGQALVRSGQVPLVRQSHSAIYDPVNKRVMVFGGTNPSSVFNDLSSPDLNTYVWTQLSPGGILPSYGHQYRIHHKLSFKDGPAPCSASEKLPVSEEQNRSII